MERLQNSEGRFKTGLSSHNVGTFAKMAGKKTLVAKCWEDNWANIAPCFDYPNHIRKAIYTTNAVESLNSVIRRVIKKRNVFSTDDSVFKVIWLAMKDASKKNGQCRFKTGNWR